MRAALVGLLGAACVAGCGDGGSGSPADAMPPAEVCAVPESTAVNVDLDEPLCTKLSSYRFFTGAMAEQTPNAGVVPYDLNTPLFSDYAAKDRFIWLPAGATATYDETETFVFPVGAVILKTFWYPDDARNPGAGRRILETRMLIQRSDGWEGVAYVWNDAQDDADLKVAGAALDVSWIHTDGAQRQVAYLVPNKNQCKECHEERDDVMSPIGPKARHLNRDFDYGAGPVNQLTHLTSVGYLAGAPVDPTMAPRLPVWNDEATGTVEERARGWLDINCSHCHNPRGVARTSGLDLLVSQTTPFDYGVCKPPVAAGAGSGGRQYNIVPGMPDESIITFRLESTELDIRMPELGRSLVHDEGAALIRQWITEMPGSCATP